MSYLFKKAAFVYLFSFFFLNQVNAQNVGVSVSVLIPQNGYLATPVSPLSIRGIGLDISNSFSIETGFTFYRMAGIGVKNLPFEVKEPIMGPFFTLFVPLELVWEYGYKKSVYRLKGGGFGYMNMIMKINEGNLDRSLSVYEGWDVLNSNFSFTNNPGYGVKAGMEYIYYMNRKMGISFEAYYLYGESQLGLNGSYQGGNLGGVILQKTADFSDSAIDYRGFEIGVGLLFSN